MKRLLLFLLLLAAGGFALHFAVGDEDVVSVKASESGQPAANQPEDPGAGVPVQQGRMSATVTSKGALEINPTRTLPAVDGRARKEQLFSLKYEDSKPIGAGRQQLDRVQLRLFDKGAHVATLTARQAFVALRPDANGQMALDEGKDIDLRDAVLTTEPGSRLAGLRLELANAHIKIEDDEILLTSPREEPVLVVFEGERRLTLRGLGVQALLPRSREGTLRRADLEILAQPVLETDGIVVRSQGRLHYVEDIDSGAGTVTLDDHVELDLARAELTLPGVRKVGGSLGKDGARVRGDQFVGWLQRHRERTEDGRERQSVGWRQLVLTGAPALVELSTGRLTTPKLTALPGLFGDPVSVTAHGGASRLEQTGLLPRQEEKQKARQQEKPPDLVVGTSQRRIHFVMPREQVGALYRSFGMPRWAMRPLEQLQVGVVEGAANLQSGSRSLEAADGLRIYRSEGSETGIVRGLGAVRVEQRATKADEQDLVAVGNDGFTLTSDSKRDVLLLGPLAPADLDAPGAWRDHTFDVRHGNATMKGRGVCAIERTGETTHVDFVSPDGRMVAAFPDEGLQLQRVRRLQADLVEKRPRSLDIAGWPTDITFVRGNDRVQATAPRLLQVGPRSLRLLPADPATPTTWSGLADVDRLPVVRRTTAARGDLGPQQIEVRGPCIDLHHAGGHAVLVDAVVGGDELPHVYARLDAPDGGDGTTIACAAERLRVLPFLLGPDVQSWLTGGDRGALSQVLFQRLGRPWLLVDEVREFELDDARHGHVEGRGKRLLVSQGGRAALFIGDQATATPALVTRTQDGRAITLGGARVRVFDDGDVRLQALDTFADDSTSLLPTMTLREAQRTGLLANMQATCRGDIEVLPDAVQFGGPVVARGLQPDGTPDPKGLGIDARELRMVRDRKSGDIVSMLGKGVVVDWTRVHATCAQVELDVKQSRLLATDPDDAVVTLPGGRVIRSPRVEVNYDTLTWRMTSGRVEQGVAAEGRR